MVLCGFYYDQVQVTAEKNQGSTITAKQETPSGKFAAPAARVWPEISGYWMKYFFCCSVSLSQYATRQPGRE
jgi:hypothetical protein